MSAAPLTIRRARAEDRAAALAFCAHTWAWGDYIAEVWDAWLADPRGAFVVGDVGGQVMALDKLTFLSDDEAFLEGFRIDPAYRGRGYAPRFERALLDEAARQGARVVRFLTAADNAAVQHIAERDGFRRVATLAPWSAEPDPAPDATAPPLRPLAPGNEAYHAWNALRSGPLWAAGAGLWSSHWHAQEWSAALWAIMLGAGALLTTAEGDLAGVTADPDDEALWLGGLHAPLDPQRIARLAAAVRREAAARGRAACRAILPRVPELEAGLQAAGWTGEAHADALILFELRLAERPPGEPLA
jgi:ribosomal protein S18 acetylase RimI-like enzyme